ncbi:MAG: transporter substrate-binding domain-containing protein, partial [Clostridia bacterium]
MKKMTKMLLVLVVMVIAISSCFAFVACKNTDYLYVATNATFAPFEYKENGKVVGFDIDFADALAKEMGYKGVKIKDMEFNSVILSVQKGQCDCGIAGLTVNPERLEQIDFTQTYFVAAQNMLYKGAQQNFASKEAAYKFMEGKKVAVPMGYTADGMMKAHIENADGLLYGKGTKIEAYTDGAMAVAALASGVVDVVVIDNAPAKKLAAMYADKGVVVDTNALNDKEEYAIG